MSNSPVATDHSIDTLFVAMASLAVALVLITILRDFAPPPTFDFWLHAASIEAFRQNVSSPDFVVFFEFDRRNLSPYHLVIALLARVTGVPSYHMLTYFGVVNVAMLLIGLRKIGQILPGTSRYKAGLLTLCAFSLWGVPGFYSGEYHPITLPWVAAYPSMFCFSLSLFGLYLCAEFGKTRRRRSLISILLLNLLVCAIHQLTWLYLFLPSSAIFFWYFGLNLRENASVIATSLLIALAFFLVWPLMPLANVVEIFYSFFLSKTYLMGSGGFARKGSFDTQFFSWMAIDFFGPALLGVLGWFFVRTARERLFLRLLCLVPIFCWFSSGLLEWPPMGWRFSIYIVWWLQFTAAWYFCNLLDSGQARWKLYPLLSLCALLVLSHLRGIVLTELRYTHRTFGELESELSSAESIISAEQPLAAEPEIMRLFHSLGLRVSMSKCFDRQMVEIRYPFIKLDSTLEEICLREFSGSSRIIVSKRDLAALLHEGKLGERIHVDTLKQGDYFTISRITAD